MTRRPRNTRLKCLDPYTELVEMIERRVIHSGFERALHNANAVREVQP